MGFWNAAVLVNEIRRQGMTVWPVDIQHSRAWCSVEGDGIRLGLHFVKGLREDQVTRILNERELRPYDALLDFCLRTRISGGSVENLIMAGGMDGWGIPRRQLMWELGTLNLDEKMLDLVYRPQEVNLPPQTLAESMLAEQDIMGLSPGDHIMTLYRDRLNKENILGSHGLADCLNGQRVKAAGLLVVHQSPPTAKGFHFLTLEDEDGMINVIVRPKVYGRCRNIIRGAHLLLVAGMAQREGEVINLLADSIAPLIPKS
jgi:error-prone DNA polymerase